MKFNTQYKIFVSSPGDVAKEREIVDSVIARINDSISDSLGIYLTVERWEKMPPETTDEVLQDRLNTKIKDCHFFLLILYKRYGTVMQGETISNTEREINAILEYLTKDQKKKILAYQDFKHLINLIACFHSICRFVIRPLIFYSQLIQQVICTNFSQKSSVYIIRSAAK